MKDFFARNEIADIARRAEEVAARWMNGANYKELKEIIFDLRQECKNIPIGSQDPDRFTIIGAKNAILMLLEATRNAACNRDIKHSIFKEIVSLHMTLTSISAPSYGQNAA